MEARTGYYSEKNRDNSYKQAQSKPIRICESHNKIVAALEGTDGLANFQIAEITGLTTGGVCGRIGELKELGVVRDSSRKVMGPHNVNVTVWELVKQTKIIF